MEKNGWAGVPAPQGGNPSPQFVSLFVRLFFTPNSFIGSPSPHFVPLFVCFSLFFCIHSISFIGSGQVYRHKEAIHPSAHFVPNKACNCVRNKIQHLFLLHALKAPSSDRLRPGLPRWAKSVMGPKSSRNQNIFQDIYVDLYM